MENEEQRFDTFRGFLEELRDNPEKYTLDDPKLVIPEEANVLTSTLTLEQCFTYLADKTLRSSVKVRPESDAYIISFEENNLPPLLIASRAVALSQSMEDRCYQMRLDRAVAGGARYFICYFRQQEQPWGNPTIEVSFIHPKQFPRDQVEAAQRKAKELEKERYDKKDMNLQIEARLAKSAEDAKAGIFLDS